VWRHLGDVDHYVEPFCGSAAVLLARPIDDRYLGRYREMINDKAGFVSNFWRALKAEPAELADYMDWPINEVDLYARQQWLVQRAESLAGELEADPLAYDLQAAAWWAWGASCWIGSNWATDGRRAKPNMTPRGVNRLSLDTWDIDGYLPINRSLREYIQALSARLRQVRVLCGDWKRCVKPSEMKVSGSVGVFLDPPYAGNRQKELYYHDDPMTEAVTKFCQEWGDMVRIVLAGYDDEYDLPGWHSEGWTGRRAFSSSKETANHDNRHRERLWVSPACPRRVIQRA
jgi:site-specific DNA-adenine methylase